MVATGLETVISACCVWDEMWLGLAKGGVCVCVCVCVCACACVCLFLSLLALHTCVGGCDVVGRSGGV